MLLDVVGWHALTGGRAWGDVSGGEVAWLVEAARGARVTRPDFEGIAEARVRVGQWDGWTCGAASTHGDVQS